MMPNWRSGRWSGLRRKAEADCLTVDSVCLVDLSESEEQSSSSASASRRRLLETRILVLKILMRWAQLQSVSVLHWLPCRRKQQM